MFHTILNSIISSPITLFSVSVLFTYASFQWVRKLLIEFRYSLWTVLAAGALNGSIAVLAENLTDKPQPSLMMFFVPLAVVVELWMVSKDLLWSYFFLLASFLLNFCAVHDLAVAALGLWANKELGSPYSVEYRMAVFTLALLIGTVMLVILTKFMPVKELFIMVHSREKGLLLVMYMVVGSVMLLISAAVTVPVLFNDMIAEEFRTPAYIDVMLKDMTILAFSYMIALQQCRVERESQKSDVLEGKLHREERFRTVIQEELSAARLDAVTGLHNRASMEKSLQKHFQENKVSGTMFVIDMDNFKKVNDSLGHKEGDRVLREMGEVLQNEFRQQDIIGRIGGDEFCIFAVNLIEPESIKKKADDLLKKSMRTHITDQGEIFQTTNSIGIAHCPEHGSDYETLFECADIALYRAKRKGKNRFCIYSGEKRMAYNSSRTER